MKILILTAWYYPLIHPRAQRWTVLAEQWAAEGVEVHVLTARLGNSKGESEQNGVRIHRRGFDSLKEWVYYLLGTQNGRGRVGAAPGSGNRLLERVYKATWKKLFFPDDACVWYFPAKRKLFQLIEQEGFDAFVSVSLPFTGHLLGLAVKRNFPELRWLADIGDPFALQANPPNNQLLYKRRNFRLEQKVLETADMVTVTTAATLEKYAAVFGEQILANAHVIAPIYQPLTPAIHHKNSDRIKLGYFGALYAPTRTPDAFLALLSRIEARRPDLYSRLEVHFYGEIFPEFYEELSAKTLITLHGLCSRMDAQKAMGEMDVLLNIGNITDFQLPSKAVDYLAAGKAVLNLSYVEKDPFSNFFADNTLIYNVSVKNGIVSEEDVRNCIGWLESEKNAPDAKLLAKKVAPFLPENIAAQYMHLLTSAAKQ